MAVLGPLRISGVVVVDAVGIEVPGHPVADFFSLSFAELAEHSYADPERYGIDPSTLPPEALRAHGRQPGLTRGVRGTDHDRPDAPRPARRRGRTDLVLWGEADRIGDVDFGRAFAATIPGAEFRLIANAGHLPQIEAPDVLVELVRSFADLHRRA